MRGVSRAESPDKSKPMNDHKLTIRHVASGYHPAEWWYPHLCNGMAADVRVTRLPAPHRTEPGFDWAEPVAGLWPGGAAPDLFIGSVGMLFPDIHLLSCPTAVWFDYFPEDVEHFSAIRLFDHVFVSSKDAVERLKRLGSTDTRWLPHGFDATLQYDQRLDRSLDVGFLGATHLRTHEKRRVLLKALAARYKINDHTKPAFGNEMYRVYNQCKMVVNLTNLGGFNMRNFETMASGAMLLTDTEMGGMDDLFQERTHFVRFSGAEDLFRKIDYYLAHPGEREAIARAGQAEVIAKHSYGHRAREVIAHVATAGGARHRTSDPNIIARAHSTWYHRGNRLDLLLRLLKRPGLSPATRLYALKRTARALVSSLRKPSPV
jgi:hypothetical protein